VTLHVTNGDVAVERIRQAAVDGEILPWQDPPHDGPVLRRITRARKQCFWEMRASSPCSGD
jgi:hypothetical protein